MFTEQDLAWIQVALEDRIEMLEERRDWNESEGLHDVVSKLRDEIKTYETILNKITARGGLHDEENDCRPVNRYAADGDFLIGS